MAYRDAPSCASRFCVFLGLCHWLCYRFLLGHLLLLRHLWLLRLSNFLCIVQMIDARFIHFAALSIRFHPKCAPNTVEAYLP